MTGITADATDDVGSKVALLGTVVLAVTDFTTILACLVLVVTKGSVQSGEFSKLVALQSILTFGD